MTTHSSSAVPSSLPRPSLPTGAGTSSHRRALVLGGGGSTGNAWLIGVLAGLSEAGCDAAAADRIIGTSAGATAGAQLAGATPAQLLDAILSPLTPAQARPAASRPAPTPTATATAPQSAEPPRAAKAGPGAVVDHLERMHRLIAESTDAADLRRRLGASALERLAASDGAWQERWRATVASRLQSQDWPERELLLTAIDASTGDSVVLDQSCGVPLADAVAASTSSGLPYLIGERWLLDGGFRRNENADLATGFERVLVLAPFAGKSFTPPEWGLQLDAQLAELRESGSEIETIFPGDEFDHLFGANAMDFSLRPAAAEAGFERGQRFAADHGAFWV